MICRRHWLYLYPRLLVQALAAILPPTLIAVILSRADTYEGVAAKIFWLVAGLYLIYWGVRIFLTWYRYNHDIWVITNQRIVDSLKTSPFSLKLSTADLVNIQDMTVERNGLLRTIFNFGDIICQTAAELQEFRLSAIPKPVGVQALVDKERDRERMRSAG